MNGCLKELAIRIPADISLARQSAACIGRQLRFDDRTVAQLITVASELASNLVQHARDGKMIFSQLTGIPSGLKIETIDSGPGISSIEKALTDGFSTSNCLGCGLGAVNRLMDTLEIVSLCTDGPGTRISCCRFHDPPLPYTDRMPFETGAASRSVPGMKANGDGFVIKSQGQSLLVGVIDGIGHGEHAHLASEKIRHYVQTHSHLSLPLIFQGAGRASQGTRGAVMSLVCLDWSQKPWRLCYGALGNIEAMIVSEKSLRLPVRRGILGTSPIRPTFLEMDFFETETLVLFSDGVMSHWAAEDERLLQEKTATEGARVLLARLAKANDDATIVVVKSTQEKKR